MCVRELLFEIKFLNGMVVHTRGVCVWMELRERKGISVRCKHIILFKLNNKINKSGSFPIMLMYQTVSYGQISIDKEVNILRHIVYPSRGYIYRKERKVFRKTKAKRHDNDET